VDATELLKRVRKIEIKTRGLSKNIFAGEYHSAFKGRGMAFSEVREYGYGDDVRNIDWNVTARFNKPFVKVFEEERELTVMLLIDVSGSNEFGTRGTLKKNIMAEVAAVLSFSAIHNNDKIGAILFSDKIEMFIPPKKGKTHTLRIIRELINFTPTSKGTDITEGLRYLTNVIKKRCTTFLLSDMINYNDDGYNPAYEDALKIAANKHDLAVLRIFDPGEKELPPVGLLRVTDAETGEDMWIDSADKRVRRQYAEWWQRSQDKASEVLAKYGIDSTQISTNEDYVKPLLMLFKNRN
jgi:uncharacterized protein (DUF58 family)